MEVKGEEKRGYGDRKRIDCEIYADTF